MSRKASEPLEALTRIIQKRQPLSLRDVRNYAACYKAMAGWNKEFMHNYIREHFAVDENNKVTLREE